jgi:hypothetical protein
MVRYNSSDTLVNTLTIYAINTGAFTASISLCTLVFVRSHPVLQVERVGFILMVDSTTSARATSDSWRSISF